MKELSIDIETFCEVDIKTAGAYKYAEKSEIILFGYSVDKGPPQCVDLLSGEQIPKDILAAIADPAVRKTAHNAAFELENIGKHLGVELDPSSWRCSAVLSAIAGYPMSLDEASKALGTAEKKDSEGKALIRFFCIPCKPTKANGGRTRNLPEHAPEKWAKFIEYCKQDVVTEQAICDKLDWVSLPEIEHKLWCLDQQINRRGWKVDLELAAAAMKIDDVCRMKLTKEAMRISGLSNPNSVAQLKDWFLEQGLDLPIEIVPGKKDKISLSAETVNTSLEKLLAGDLDLIVDDVEAVRRMLEIRQEMSKTSIKKYQAMFNAAGRGDRVRGLFQFVGAGRTWRWCLTGDHEILTPNGWVRLDEWAGGVMACWNPLGEAISFQKATPNEFDYAGEMHHIEHQRCSQISTPEHTMPYWDNGWKSMEVKNLPGRFRIPFTGRKQNNQRFEDYELRILIMVQADGHYTEWNDVRFNFSKNRKIERCKTLLRRAGIPFSVSVRKTTTCITVYNRDMPLFIRVFKAKVFGYWMLDENADVIFDELEYWDGSRTALNSLQYSSVIKTNVDIIQALATLSGRSCTVLERKRSNDNWKTAYVANIWLSPGKCAEVKNANSITKHQFEGKVYCPTTTTGFFMVRRSGKVWVTGNSGRLVQVQNLKRISMGEKTLMLARQAVKEGNMELLEMCFDSISDVLSQLIRTSFISEKDKRLIISDFSAIEARVLAWVADEEWVLEVFRTHGMIYEATASRMMDKPIKDVTKADRQKGKIGALLLGYGGGPDALERMGAEKMGLSKKEQPKLVKDWRAANPNIVAFWRNCERAAKNAIKMGGQHSVGNKGIFFSMKNRALLLTLPSGRSLMFPDAAVELFMRKVPVYETQIDKDGDEVEVVVGHKLVEAEKITFLAVDQYTRKWGKSSTYGGKLCENICQAIARDCLANAMLNLDAIGIDICSHVHDEVIAEMLNSVTSLEEVNKMMLKAAPWMEGLPLGAAGDESTYYNK